MVGKTIYATGTSTNSLIHSTQASKTKAISEQTIQICFVNGEISGNPSKTQERSGGTHFMKTHRRRSGLNGCHISEDWRKKNI